MSVRNHFPGLGPYLALSAVVLLFRVATALPIERAGYMDASYTLHVAANLALGRGFSEDVLWNYLDAPAALPHPSNFYWQPLPALLAAGSFLLFGASYHAAQVPFLVLSLIPPLFAFYLARRMYGRDDYAWTAGLLTAFSGFYTVFWVAPDNFAPFAVTTDLALLWMAFGLERKEGKAGAWFLSGIFVGLSQWSRTDAFLLLAVVPLVILLARRGPSIAARDAAFAALGFLLVYSPWLARNYFVAGSPLAPGGTRALLLTSYDELFRYHAADLTLARYLSWGLPNIVNSKLNALGFDLLVLLFGSLQIFLAPCAAIGLWRGRARTEFGPALVYLALLLAAMALVFTFPSVRGSMLHSSAALVPYFAAAVPPGLDVAVEWIARRRRAWSAASARRFFQVGFVALAFVISVFLYAQGVFGGIGSAGPIALWNARDSEYLAVGRALDARGVSLLQPVLAVDPPSFFDATGRRSIAIPTDSTEAVLEAAHRFGAQYLVLQYDHPRTLNDLYEGRGVVDGLTPVATCQDALGRRVTLFQIGQ